MGLKTSKNIEVYGRTSRDKFGGRKSLIACALRRFGVAPCCSPASLSKRGSLNHSDISPL